jgi:hypothetical protein
MSRRSSRRSQNSQKLEEEEEEDDIVESKPSQSRSSLSQSERRSSSQLLDEEEEEEDESMLFSSQLPEASQSIPAARASDRNNLNKLSETARSKAITDLTRLVLFRGLAGEPIDRTKCVKDAGISDARVSSAVFEEANLRLQNLFNFELRRMPVWMERIKNLPTKYKDRYYLINSDEDTAGNHCKAIHAVHEQSAVEKGLLMVVLALCYSRGEPRGDGSRWILDKDLYMLLNKTDENIPIEPARTKRQTASTPRSRGTGGVSQTPNVDALLHKFVKHDYLLCVKASDLGFAVEDELAEYYSLGPRAAMEIGRKQIVYFCAEILDEDPDPTMLHELQQDEEGVEAGDE